MEQRILYSVIGYRGRHRIGIVAIYNASKVNLQQKITKKIGVILIFDRYRESLT
jgi:hypothetical protein